MADLKFTGSTVEVGFSTDNLYDLDLLLLKLYANHKQELQPEDLQAVTRVTDILKRLRQDTRKQGKSITKRMPPPLPLRSVQMLKER